MSNMAVSRIQREFNEVNIDKEVSVPARLKSKLNQIIKRFIKNNLGNYNIHQPHGLENNELNFSVGYTEFSFA